MRSAWPSPSRLSRRAKTRPATGRFQIAVRTTLPCHAISRGRPTLTDRSFGIGSSNASGADPRGKSDHPRICFDLRQQHRDPISQSVLPDKSESSRSVPFVSIYLRESNRRRRRGRSSSSARLRARWSSRSGQLGRFARQAGPRSLRHGLRQTGVAFVGLDAGVADLASKESSDRSSRASCSTFAPMGTT